MPPWLLEILAWVPLVLVLVAALVCFLHLRLSKRILFLLIGFLLLAIADMGFRAYVAMQQGGQRVDFVTISQIMLVLRITAWGLIVGGLAAVMADLRERVDVPIRDVMENDGRKPWEKS